MKDLCNHITEVSWGNVRLSLMAKCAARTHESVWNIVNDMKPNAPQTATVFIANNTRIL